MPSFFKSMTHMAVCLALALPTAGAAQSVKACGNKPSFPCKMKIGKVVENNVQLLEARIQHLIQVKDKAQRDQLDAQLDGNYDAADEKAAKALERANRLLAEAQADLTRVKKNRAQRLAQKDKDKERKAAQRAQREADRKAERRAQREAERKAERRAQRQAARKAEQRAQREADRKAEQRAQRQADRKAEQRAERKAEERRQRQRERRRARREAAAAAEAGVVQEVEQESLTRENVRASDQEYREDDGGLSKFEKALLLGLGAVAVGKILDNGDEVVSRSGDRVVVRRDGELRVLKDDDALLRQAGNDVKTETFSDGSTRSTVTRPNGDRIVTIRASDGSVLRRVRVTPAGEQFVLFDDTVEEREVVVNELPTVQPRNLPAGVAGVDPGSYDESQLRAALRAELGQDPDRRFSLRQIRNIPEVRALAPEIELNAVQFRTGSAAIEPQQARSLAQIGTTISDIIAAEPRTVFLVEGHTDAVGDATYNLALSDRRAETVALALTEYFRVPPENLITQGYGEEALKIPTYLPEPANRRAVVRNITDLLR